VAETSGLVLTWQGKIFQAYFQATCGGETAPAWRYFREAEIPPLRGVKCPYCRESPYWSWVVAYREKDVRKALSRELSSLGIQGIGPILNIVPLRRRGELYPAYFRIEHEKGSFEVEALFLRKILNSVPPKGKFLSVAVTEVVRRGAVFEMHGRGWGHGVGLCQYGARRLAQSGWNFWQILSYYFPGAELTRVW